MRESEYPLTHAKACEAMEKGYVVGKEPLHNEADSSEYELREYQVFHAAGSYWGGWHKWRFMDFKGAMFRVLGKSNTCPMCGQQRVRGKS